MKIKNILPSATISENATGTSDQDYDVYNLGGRSGKPMNIDIGLGGTGRGGPPKASNFKSKTVVPAAPTSQVKPPATTSAASGAKPAVSTAAPATAAKPTTTPTRIEPTLTPPRIVVKPGETAAQAVQRTQKDIQAKTAPAGKQKIEPNLAGGPPQVWRKGDGTTPIGTPAAAKGQTITGKVGTQSPAPIASPSIKSGLGLAGAAALTAAGYNALTGDNKPAVITTPAAPAAAPAAATTSAYKGSAGAQEIARASGVKNVNVIKPGQLLTLPGQSTPYKVQKGDTLDKIARQNKTAPAASAVTPPSANVGDNAGEFAAARKPMSNTAPASNVNLKATADRDRIAKLAIPQGTSAPSQINPAVISKEPAGSPDASSSDKPVTRGGSNNPMQPNIIAPQDATMPLPANVASMSPADAATELRAAQAAAGKPVLEPGANVVGDGIGGSLTSGTGELWTARSGDQISWENDKSNYGKQYPGAEKAAQQAADKKASGDRNLSAVKNFFGFGDKSEVKEGDDALAHIKQLSTITKESKETHMSMDFKKMFGIMDAIAMNEAKMADIKGTKHSGSYGSEYQGDEDDETTDTKSKSVKEPAEKKGRGRPKGDVVATNPKDTAAKRAADKESKAYAKANPTKVTRHTLSDKPPKGSLEYKEKTSKKSSLKDWVESAEEMIAERAMNKYAIGMAVAKKQADDEPPLKKSTIVKAHEIAKKIDEEQINEVVRVDKIGYGSNAFHSDEYGPETQKQRDDLAKQAKHVRAMNRGGADVNTNFNVDDDFGLAPKAKTGRHGYKSANEPSSSSGWSGHTGIRTTNKPAVGIMGTGINKAAPAGRGKGIATPDMDEATELKGGQKKLDVAPPKGKLDAKDFAALRAKKTVKESTLMDDAHTTLDHITNRFKHEVKRFLSNPGMDMDDDLYEALYDYYVDSGEMPYGIAKARTGDPYQWVYNRFQADMGGDQFTAETTMLPEAFGSGETVYWRGKSGQVDRVEGDKCFVTTASGDMDVWPAGECSKEKQSAFSIFKKDVSDIGTGLGKFATGRSEIDEAELEESPFTYAAKMAKATGKDSFTLGNKQFDVKESTNMDKQLVNWDAQLNSLLNESLTISTTQGDQGDDTISVTASGSDAQDVMALIRNAGLGGMGNKQDSSQQFSNYGVPMSGDQDHEGTALITVDDGQSGGDDMLSLMKKMSGMSSDESSDDYQDEESSDDYQDEESSDEESESCSECGMSESEGGCEHTKMASEEVDESEACGDEEEIEESFANSDDDTATQDIEFMTRTISGGLNREKRDQTTLPHTQVKVAESSDLMTEFLKLSGLR